MAIDGQVFFHRILFADSVKLLRCATESVESGNDIDLTATMVAQNPACSISQLAEIVRIY